MATLYNGLIYLTGGYGGQMATAYSLQTYNIATSTFSTISFTGSFTYRWLHSATLVGSLIYIIGGGKAGGNNNNEVWVLDTASNAFSQVTYSGSFTGREGHCGIYWNGGIYVFGGHNDNVGGTTNFNDMNLFFVPTNTWSQISYSGSTSTRAYFGSVLYNNAIYIIAGSVTNFQNSLATDAVKFDLQTRTFSSLSFTGSYSGRYIQGGSTVIYGNTLYTIGGYSSSNTAQSNTVQLSNLPTGTIIDITYYNL